MSENVLKNLLIIEVKVSGYTQKNIGNQIVYF